jgi:phage terminase large subunit-like protein
MMGNVVAKVDAKEHIYPRKEQPGDKIDGPVALIMAMGRAMLRQDAGDFTGFLSNPVRA